MGTATEAKLRIREIQAHRAQQEMLHAQKEEEQEEARRQAEEEAKKKQQAEESQARVQSGQNSSTENFEEASFSSESQLKALLVDGKKVFKSSEANKGGITEEHSKAGYKYVINEGAADKPQRVYQITIPRLNADGSHSKTSFEKIYLNKKGELLYHNKGNDESLASQIDQGWLNGLTKVKRKTQEHSASAGLEHSASSGLERTIADGKEETPTTELSGEKKYTIEQINALTKIKDTAIRRIKAAKTAKTAEILRKAAIKDKLSENIKFKHDWNTEREKERKAKEALEAKIAADAALEAKRIADIKPLTLEELKDPELSGKTEKSKKLLAEKINAFRKLKQTEGGPPAYQDDSNRIIYDGFLKAAIEANNFEAFKLLKAQSVGTPITKEQETALNHSFEALKGKTEAFWAEQQTTLAEKAATLSTAQLKLKESEEICQKIEDFPRIEQSLKGLIESQNALKTNLKLVQQDLSGFSEYQKAEHEGTAKLGLSIQEITRLRQLQKREAELTNKIIESHGPIASALDKFNARQKELPDLMQHLPTDESLNLEKGSLAGSLQRITLEAKINLYKAQAKTQANNAEKELDQEMTNLSTRQKELSSVSDIILTAGVNPSVGDSETLLQNRRTLRSTIEAIEFQKAPSKSTQQQCILDIDSFNKSPETAKAPPKVIHKVIPKAAPVITFSMSHLEIGEKALELQAIIKKAQALTDQTDEIKAQIKANTLILRSEIFLDGAKEIRRLRDIKLYLNGAGIYSKNFDNYIQKTRAYYEEKANALQKPDTIELGRLWNEAHAKAKALSTPLPKPEKPLDLSWKTPRERTFNRNRLKNHTAQDEPFIIDALVALKTALKGGPPLDLVRTTKHDSFPLNVTLASAAADRKLVDLDVARKIKEAEQKKAELEAKKTPSKVSVTPTGASEKEEPSEEGEEPSIESKLKQKRTALATLPEGVPDNHPRKAPLLQAIKDLEAQQAAEKSSKDKEEPSAATLEDKEAPAARKDLEKEKKKFNKMSTKEKIDDIMHNIHAPNGVPIVAVDTKNIDPPEGKYNKQKDKTKDGRTQWGARR